MSYSIEKLWKEFNLKLEEYIDINLPKEYEEPSILHQAMRYSLSGGKRVRPFLAFIGYKLNKDEVISELYDLALALELIHNFSLVHDDLPALDNDDYRRGKLTVHKKFSEAIAILTGDALFAYAFKILNKLDKKIIDIIIDALLSKGMIGGQVIDIQKDIKNLNDLMNLHYYKTGKLIEASIVSGYVLAGGEKLDILKVIGKNIGLVFQIVDDILDKEKNEDITILKFLDYKSIKELLMEIKSTTIKLIDENFQKNGYLLKDFVLYLLNRNE
jgi:geranylgeranyl diphosphate synthase type II